MGYAPLFNVDEEENVGNMRDDAVHTPAHYKTFPDTEAITIIRKALSREEFIGYLKGNVLKYRLRAGEKDNLEQDIAKADKYREWLGDYY